MASLYDSLACTEALEATSMVPAQRSLRASVRSDTRYPLGAPLRGVDADKEVWSRVSDRVHHGTDLLLSPHYHRANDSSENRSKNRGNTNAGGRKVEEHLYGDDPLAVRDYERAASEASLFDSVCRLRARADPLHTSLSSALRFAEDPYMYAPAPMPPVAPPMMPVAPLLPMREASAFNVTSFLPLPPQHSDETQPGAHAQPVYVATSPERY